MNALRFPARIARRLALPLALLLATLLPTILGSGLLLASVVLQGPLAPPPHWTDR